MPRALWWKSPFVLFRHRPVLLAVMCSACLVAMAAASAPLLRAGAESEALQGKLAQLTPLGAGLTIEPPAVFERLDFATVDRARRRAARRLAARLPFTTEPVVTTSSSGLVGGPALAGGNPL